jgi:transposase
MQMITTIGLDIAKSVFQVHGVDAAGEMVIRRQLKRRFVLAFFQKAPPCLVGIEACACVDDMLVRSSSQFDPQPQDQRGQHQGRTQPLRLFFGS